MKEHSGIYTITNKITGTIYVGSSKKVLQRLQGHKRDLRKNKHHNKNLQKDYNIYEENNFIFNPIEIVLDHELLLKEESKWVEYYKKVCDLKVYNEAAIDGIRAKSSEQCRKERSIRQKKLWENPEYKKKMKDVHKGKKYKNRRIPSWTRNISMNELLYLYNEEKYSANKLAIKYNIDSHCIVQRLKNPEKFIDSDFSYDLSKHKYVEGKYSERSRKCISNTLKEFNLTKDNKNSIL